MDSRSPILPEHHFPPVFDHPQHLVRDRIRKLPGIHPRRDYHPPHGWFLPDLACCLLVESCQGEMRLACAGVAGRFFGPNSSEYGMDQLFRNGLPTLERLPSCLVWIFGEFIRPMDQCDFSNLILLHREFRGGPANRILSWTRIAFWLTMTIVSSLGVIFSQSRSAWLAAVLVTLTMITCNKFLSLRDRYKPAWVLAIIRGPGAVDCRNDNRQRPDRHLSAGSPQVSGWPPSDR